jgi:hypothetical protein
MGKAFGLDGSPQQFFSFGVRSAASFFPQSVIN